MSSKLDQTLEKLLNGDSSALDSLEDENEEEKEPEEMLPVVYEDKHSEVELANPDLKSDYNSARSNLHGLMGDTNSAIKLALKVAMMSEHPRALEVVSNLIKTSADISKELLAIHKAIEQKQQAPNKDKGSYTQINNYNYTKDDKGQAEDIIDGLDDNDDEGDKDET